MGADNSTAGNDASDSPHSQRNRIVGSSDSLQTGSNTTGESRDRRATSVGSVNSDEIELYVFEGSSGEAAPLVEASSLDLEVEEQAPALKQQVHFKSEQGRLLLLLPADPDKSRNPVHWDELCQQLSLRLSSGDRFLQANTTVHVIARDRLLDNRQLQEIDELLKTAKLSMKRIYTQRRQTAVAAAAAGYSVEQQMYLDQLGEVKDQGKALEAPLYLQTTVRSGTEIRHPGSIVVLGDVNPGGVLIAEGDIFVWGRLRGVAQAGSEGNTTCRIMALHMQPTQLRIADQVARAPEKPPALYKPEVAYVSGDSIRIAIASEFAQVNMDGP